MKVTQDRILVNPQKPTEKKTTGGIIIPETDSSMKDMNIRGEVVSIGPDVKTVEVGNTILFSKYDGQPFEEQLILREAGIIAIL